MVGIGVKKIPKYMYIYIILFSHPHYIPGLRIGMVLAFHGETSE